MLYSVFVALIDYTILFLGSVQQFAWLIVQLLLGRIEWPS